MADRKAQEQDAQPKSEDLSGLEAQSQEPTAEDRDALTTDEGKEASLQEPPTEAPEEGMELLKKELAEKEKSLTEKTKEAADNYDRLLRVAAEFDNYKKRASRERDEYVKYANEELIKELLPVIDSCERAIKAAKTSDKIEVIAEGIELTFKQLYSVLEKRGLAYIEAADKPFDPNYHEAVMTVSGSDHRENIVVEELQRGYTLNDRVIRPSMVKVAKG
jgi:molecular chaperone GrpE